jgi:hypothetical protein
MSERTKLGRVTGDLRDAGVWEALLRSGRHCQHWRDEFSEFQGGRRESALIGYQQHPAPP